MYGTAALEGLSLRCACITNTRNSNLCAKWVSLLKIGVINPSVTSVGAVPAWKIEFKYPQVGKRRCRWEGAFPPGWYGRKFRRDPKLPKDSPTSLQDVQLVETI